MTPTHLHGQLFPDLNKALTPVEPDVKRQLRVSTLLENLPQTLNESLNISNRQGSNIPLLDVTETTVGAYSHLKLGALSLSAGNVFAPKTKEDLNSPAFANFFDALKEQGLHPYISTVTNWQSDRNRTSSFISLSRDEIESFLKQQTESYIFKAIDFIRDKDTQNFCGSDFYGKVKVLQNECLLRFPLIDEHLKKAGFESRSGIFDLVSATVGYYSGRSISGSEAVVILHHSQHKADLARALSRSNPLESGFKNLTEVHAAFASINWPVDGVNGHASHDPRNPIVIEGASSKQSYFTLSIDARTFQDPNHLAGVGRRVSKHLASSGGLKEMTPMTLGEGLVIVPYTSSSIFGLKDIHCAVFNSMDRAKHFARHHEFYESGYTGGPPASKPTKP